MAQKTIGFVFVPGFADWEYGMLAASAVEWFGARSIALTPDGKPVKGISGFTLSPQRTTDPGSNADLDAVAVIGSDQWASDEAADIKPLITAVASRGALVGAICAGTLPLARAGLLAGRSHTSNGREWILGHVADYAGAEHYQDVPHAVTGGSVVTAPGSAPGTFAAAFLEALYPERRQQVGEMRTLLAREYAGTN